MPPRSKSTWLRRLALLSVIAAGGGLGACARFLVIEVWPDTVGAFDWPTFVINLSGCALIGLVMELCAHNGWRMIQAFAGVGVLGGFTTFAGYAVELHGQLSAHLVVAIVYLLTTPLVSIAATILGVVLTRCALRRVADGPSTRRLS